MPRDYGAAWAGEVDWLGTLPPRRSRIAQGLVEGRDGVDVQLRRRLGLGRLVLLRRHEEDGGPGPLDGDGLLGHAADVADVAVRVHGAGGRDRSWPPVSLPPDSLSMMPSVMASPADGPPISGVLTVTSTGKCQSCWVWARMPR